MYKILIASITLSLFQVLSWFAQPCESFASGREMNRQLTNFNIPFIKNQGQYDRSISYCALADRLNILIMEDGKIVYGRSHGSDSGDCDPWTFFWEEPYQGRPKEILGMAPVKTSINYYRGGDKETDITSVPCYRRIRLQESFDGIDIGLTFESGKMEKIFLVSPGADVSRLIMSLHNVDRLFVDSSGTLNIIAGSDRYLFSKPVAFQESAPTDGREVEKDYVQVEYMTNCFSYSFKVGAYDHSRPLIIDPFVSCTYLGGDDNDGLCEVPMIRDDQGNIYVASRIRSLSIPGAVPVLPRVDSSNYDVFIARLNSDLSEVSAIAFLGGSSNEGNWPGVDIKQGSNGDIYITGRTASFDFPTTEGVLFEGRIGGYDAFISRLGPDLDTLKASTYFGGSGHEYYLKLVIDSTDNVYLLGSTASSVDFPTTVGAYDRTFNGLGSGPYPGDLFVSKMNSELSILYASTFVGGSSGDWCEDVAIAPNGNIYFTGWTMSSNYPTIIGCYDRTFAGGYFDGFVSCLNPDLSSMVASTLIGGSEWDFGYALAIDADGNVFIGGHTESTNSSAIPFPITAGAYQEVYAGGGSSENDDGFVAKFDAGLTTLLASTYYGASRWESVFSLDLSDSGQVVIAGNTTSSKFIFPEHTIDTFYNGGLSLTGDAFLGILDTSLTTSSSFTYFGGGGAECLGSVVLGDSGYIYIAGSTNTPNLPTTAGAFQTEYGGATGSWTDESYAGDMFLARLTFAKGCCVEVTGNVNCSTSEEPDISDIVRLIDYLYLSHEQLCCPAEAETNGDCGAEPDISDIVRIIDFLYLPTHTPPVACDHCYE